MRWSKSYLPTFKESPAEAEIPSHQLMIRAGLIKKLTAGVYTFLPTGWKVLRKVENIVREEMDRIGSQEILMPILHPSELYEESGRFKHFGPELFKLTDRKERLFALGPTHEEVVTDLARAELKSYRQLPQTLYQILTKFRDEIRPRFGVMRAREFIMKDAYSFHESHDSLDETYRAMAGAYRRILDRCGLRNAMVEADAGKIGGDINHEFVVFADAGESEIATCTNCDYTANSERAESRGAKRKHLEPKDGPTTVATPGARTIDEVSAFLKADPQQLVKTLLYKSQDKVVAVLVPGERSLNETKLEKALSDPYVEALSESEVEKLTGADVGFAGPVGLRDDVRVIADPLLGDYDGMVVGANQTDAHLRGVAMGRDFQVSETVDLVNVEAGDACARCDGGTLKIQRGIELGHIFKLDTKYSKAMGATFQDAEGKEHPFIMGCYGFGVSRAVAAAIEANHDERGIVWPKAVAPFHALVLPIKVSDDAVMGVANAIYDELRGEGWDVLMDDRDLRPGVKFKDAELLGVPLRFTVGERNLKNGQIEVFDRVADESQLIAKDSAPEFVRNYYQ